MKKLVITFFLALPIIAIISTRYLGDQKTTSQILNLTPNTKSVPDLIQLSTVERIQESAIELAKIAKSTNEKDFRRFAQLGRAQFEGPARQLMNEWGLPTDTIERVLDYYEHEFYLQHKILNTYYKDNPEVGGDSIEVATKKLWEKKNENKTEALVEMGNSELIVLLGDNQRVVKLRELENKVFRDLAKQQDRSVANDILTMLNQQGIETEAEIREKLGDKAAELLLKSTD